MPKLFSNHRLVMLLCGAIGFPPPFFRFVFWDAPSGENRRWRRQRALTGISPPSPDKSLPAALFLAILRFSAGRGLFHPLVAKAPHRGEVFGVAGLRLYLHPQPTHIHIHYLVIAKVAVAPYSGQQGAAV